MAETDSRRNKKIICVLEYILAASIVLECNTVISQLYGIHYLIRGSLCLIAAICSILIIVIRKKPIRVNKFIVAAIFIIPLLMLLNTDNMAGYFIILLPLTAVLFSFYLLFSSGEIESIKSVIRKFVKIVFILAIVSLFFWVFGSLLKVIPSSGTVKYLWGRPYSVGESFFFLHNNAPGQTAWSWRIFGDSVFRNSGIFAEAPMFSFVLAVALVLNIWLKRDKMNIIREIIFIVTIVTTFSASGIVCAFFVLAYRLLQWLLSIKNKQKRCILVIVISLAIAAAIVFSWEFIFNKISASSTSHRLLDFRNGLRSFAQNPILGNGINSPRPDELSYTSGYGYSNAIVPVLVDGGIVLASHFVAAFCAFINRMKKDKYRTITTVLVCVSLGLTSLVSYRLVTVFLVAAGLSLAPVQLIRRNDASKKRATK